MRLKDKVAIITGGDSGIGQATAELFGEEGAKVIVADIDPKGGETTARTIRDNGGSAHFVRADISKETDCKDISNEAMKVFGRRHPSQQCGNLCAQGVRVHGRGMATLTGGERDGHCAGYQVCPRAST